MNVGGHTHIALDFFESSNGIAERDVGGKIERERHRGILALVINGEGGTFFFPVGDGGKRHHGAGGSERGRGGSSSGGGRWRGPRTRRSCRKECPTESPLHWSIHRWTRRWRRYSTPPCSWRTLPTWPVPVVVVVEMSAPPAVTNDAGAAEDAIRAAAACGAARSGSCRRGGGGRAEIGHGCGRTRSTCLDVDIAERVGT